MKVRSCECKMFDLVIKNARVVRPNKTGVECLDIAIKDGKVTRLAPEIRAEDAAEVFDAEEAVGLSRLRRCAHACRDLPAAAR